MTSLFAIYNVLLEYPGVVSVKPNTYHQVHTTRSWDFLGISYGRQQPSLSVSSSRLLRKAKHGEDVIVGVIGTGSDFDKFTHSIGFKSPFD
jgi:hypothetical protein